MSSPPEAAAQGMHARLHALRQGLRNIRAFVSAGGLRTPQTSLDRREPDAGVDVALERLDATLVALERRHHEMHFVLDGLLREVQAQGRVLELIYEEESQNLERLHELRGTERYDVAFTDPEPLVSVVIPTYTAYELLASRAIPSALAQTHGRIEVVVVGDAAPEATAAAIESLGDDRVRYENLSLRAPYPEDPVEFWRVAGTPPWNRAWELARGAWIAPLNDDDAFRPDHVERLLELARANRCEVAYGSIEHHHPDGKSEVVTSWPPESHAFGWQAALVHAGLRFMPMQLGSGALGVPGDWSLCRRMRRAGVRFAHLDSVVVDYYPSKLWSDAR